ncbi:ATPase family associated with various cellular activities (AAA) domain-containing protein [Phthorimaea operculella]|nr:ATPase family associated with various cellular activities (AAA) domain-containing protein [Phthorimaea operculella]
MNILYVEALQKRDSRASADYIESLVRSHLSNFAALAPGAVLTGSELETGAGGELSKHVSSIALCDAEHEAGEELRTIETELRIHVLSEDPTGGVLETLGAAEDEPAPVEVWPLPAAQLHGIWESLVFEDSLKADTLRFVETAFEFEARGVDSRQVAWNRVVLLHGPPGTGKTSLCRALAHKLAVRLSDRFPRARLLEINAHGLFSKWFSESGKLVARLFDKIQEILEDEKMLVCVLVDEVESLAAARRAAVAGLEPSDSIRAVNAVLGALDRLRRAPNALVLATSNVTAAVDAAFLDRADIARLVPAPGARAAYAVLRGALGELMSRGVVAPREPLFALRVLAARGDNDLIFTAVDALPTPQGIKA